MDLNGQLSSWRHDDSYKQNSFRYSTYTYPSFLWEQPVNIYVYILLRRKENCEMSHQLYTEFIQPGASFQQHGVEAF